MGVTIYLSIYKDKVNTVLFEIENSFPYFWVCLLDPELIANKESDWLEPATYLDTNLKGEEVGLINHDILITKEKLLTNSNKHKPFIAEYYPTALALYTDFITNLTQHLCEGAVIRLDIHEYIWCYKNQQDFITEITNEVNALEYLFYTETRFLIPTELIYTGTGYATEYNEAFEDLPSYQDANTIDWEDDIITEPSYKPHNRLKTVLLCTVIILIAIILSMMMN